MSIPLDIGPILSFDHLLIVDIINLTLQQLCNGLKTDSNTVSNKTEVVSSSSSTN